jgi:ADP-ribose pyrophosphatase YjhB (NUDIX family)
MNLPNNQPCPHCGRYNVRAVTLDAVTVNSTDQILLVKRGREPYKGFWGNPGGHLDWDETTEEGAIRELKEETGLDAQSITFLNIYTKPERHPKQAISIAYLIKASGEPKAADDADEVQWYDLSDLPEQLAFDHKTIIEDYLKNR